MARQTTELRGGGIAYLPPELSVIDMAVEQGIAQSYPGQLTDIPYDDSWAQNQ